MFLVSEELHIETMSELSVCKRAFTAASDNYASFAVNQLHIDDSIGEDATQQVLKGLARVSLCEAGYDWHGLTQAEADFIIRDLSGDVEEFFQPLLHNN